MDPQLYEQLLNRIKAKGLNVSKMEVIQHKQIINPVHTCIYDVARLAPQI
mgnify:FL=1